MSTLQALSSLDKYLLEMRSFLDKAKETQGDIKSRKEKLAKKKLGELAVERRKAVAKGKETIKSLEEDAKKKTDEAERLRSEATTAEEDRQKEDEKLRRETTAKEQKEKEQTEAKKRQEEAETAAEKARLEKSEAESDLVETRKRIELATEEAGKQEKAQKAANEEAERLELRAREFLNKVGRVGDLAREDKALSKGEKPEPDPTAKQQSLALLRQAQEKRNEAATAGERLKELLEQIDTDGERAERLEKLIVELGGRIEDQTKLAAVAGVEAKNAGEQVEVLTRTISKCENRIKELAGKKKNLVLKAEKLESLVLEIGKKKDEALKKVGTDEAEAGKLEVKDLKKNREYTFQLLRVIHQFRERVVAVHSDAIPKTLATEIKKSALREYSKKAKYGDSKSLSLLINQLQRYADQVQQIWFDLVQKTGPTEAWNHFVEYVKTIIVECENLRADFLKTYRCTTSDPSLAKKFAGRNKALEAPLKMLTDAAESRNETIVKMLKGEPLTDKDVDTVRQVIESKERDVGLARAEVGRERLGLTRWLDKYENATTATDRQKWAAVAQALTNGLSKARAEDVLNTVVEAVPVAVWTRLLKKSLAEQKSTDVPWAVWARRFGLAPGGGEAWIKNGVGNVNGTSIHLTLYPRTTSGSVAHGLTKLQELLIGSGVTGIHTTWERLFGEFTNGPHAYIGDNRQNGCPGGLWNPTVLPALRLALTSERNLIDGVINGFIARHGLTVDEDSQRQAYLIVANNNAT